VKIALVEPCPLFLSLKTKKRTVLCTVPAYDSVQMTLAAYISSRVGFYVYTEHDGNQSWRGVGGFVHTVDFNGHGLEG
jgi:hypothetical protein